MNLKEIKIKHSKKIEQAEIDLLLSFVLKKPVEFILSHPEKSTTKIQEKKIKELIQRRIKGEPIAYLIGKKEFFGLDFFVNKNVLIPRPETEIMVEEILSELGKGNKKTSVLDMGCGSGNIIISLLKNSVGKNVKLLASDISKEALKVAGKNIKKQDQEKRIKLFLSDLLNNKKLIKELIGIDRLIIAANLPYIPNAYLSQKKTIKTIGLKYEPRLALAGGRDGLDIYKRLIKETLKIKDSFPKLRIISFYEIELKQKQILQRYVQENTKRVKIEFLKDLADKWRFCKITF